MQNDIVWWATVISVDDDDDVEGAEMQSPEWIQFTMNERNKFLGKAQHHLSPKASSLFLSSFCWDIQPAIYWRDGISTDLPMKHKSSPADEDTQIENN